VLNAAAILLAGLAVLLRVPEIPVRAQQRLQALLGVLVLGLGFHVTWRACSGTASAVVRLLAIASISLVLGKLTGGALGLQRHSNRLGEFAGRVLYRRAGPAPDPAWGRVFRASTVVFCATPIAVVGAFQAAWGGDERLFFVKAAVDGLATLSLVRSAGGAVALSALPVLAVQGSLVLGLTALRPALAGSGADAAGYAASGLVLLPVALVMLQLARIRLADYLPALAWAPLLAWLSR
jgi:uncharacterized membrane protein YqgA involved in biofilm formation